MNGITKQAAAAAGIFEGMRNLRALGVEVLEFGTSFTSANFLAPASTGLTDFHFWAVGEVRLEGVGATVHCFRHGRRRRDVMQWMMESPSPSSCADSSSTCFEEKDWLRCG
jgi:hypothetical protein